MPKRFRKLPTDPDRPAKISDIATGELREKKSARKAADVRWRKT
jgi:hypothetical protein